MVSELHGDPGYPLGRFGAVIAALTDINGDELTDVAVGAPLEEQGAVYIFNGQQAGLSPWPSQVRSPACQSEPIPRQLAATKPQPHSSARLFPPFRPSSPQLSMNFSLGLSG